VSLLLNALSCSDVCNLDVNRRSIHVKKYKHVLANTTILCRILCNVGSCRGYICTDDNVFRRPGVPAWSKNDIYSKRASVAPLHASMARGGDHVTRVGTNHVVPLSSSCLEGMKAGQRLPLLVITTHWSRQHCYPPPRAASRKPAVADTSRALPHVGGAGRAC
jgi:hypothetical protein